MSEQLLKVDIQKNGVAVVRLNRPDIHNAFNDQLIELMTKAFIELDGNDKVRLVTLSGEGRSFCAGADLNWMSSMINYSMEENIQDSKKLAALFETINQFSKPVLGLINGHALGGGVGLVAVCDYVLTHEKATFGFTETRLGLIPAVISPFCIRKIGEGHARAWFMSGERFSAQKALSMGLVHEVVTVEAFETRSNELVNSFLQAAPNASKAAKALIQNVLSLDIDIVTNYTCEQIAKKRVSPEGQEGMKALLNKQTPSWMENK